MQTLDRNAVLLRALGWLAIIVAMFLLADAALYLIPGLHPADRAYDLDAPLGWLPTVLWFTWIVGLWLISRSSGAGSYLLVSGTALLYREIGPSVRNFPNLAANMLCMVAGPILLALGLRRAGFPRSVWLPLLGWLAINSVVIVGYLAPLEGTSFFWPLMAVEDVLVLVLMPILQGASLFALGAWLLRGGVPIAHTPVRLTSAST